MLILPGKLNYRFIQNDYMVPEDESTVRNPDGVLVPPTMHVIMVSAKMNSGDNRIMPTPSSGNHMNRFHQVEYTVTSNKHENREIQSWTPMNSFALVTTTLVTTHIVFVIPSKRLEMY